MVLDNTLIGRSVEGQLYPQRREGICQPKGM